MKIKSLLLAAVLSVTAASADDVMKKSMGMMNQGMNDIQAGFMNNNVSLIKSGAKLVEDGNKLFSTQEVIKQYLPTNKKHMTNTAKTHSDGIRQQLTVMSLKLDEKAYLKAGQAYADMLNACSSCHAIVRNW